MNAAYLYLSFLNIYYHFFFKLKLCHTTKAPHQPAFPRGQASAEVPKVFQYSLVSVWYLLILF